MIYTITRRHNTKVLNKLHTIAKMAWSGAQIDAAPHPIVPFNAAEVKTWETGPLNYITSNKEEAAKNRIQGFINFLVKSWRDQGPAVLAGTTSFDSFKDMLREQLKATPQWYEGPVVRDAPNDAARFVYCTKGIYTLNGPYTKEEWGGLLSKPTIKIYQFVKPVVTLAGLANEHFAKALDELNAKKEAYDELKRVADASAKAKATVDETLASLERTMETLTKSNGELTKLVKDANDEKESLRKQSSLNKLAADVATRKLAEAEKDFERAKLLASENLQVAEGRAQEIENLAERVKVAERALEEAKAAVNLDDAAKSKVLHDQLAFMKSQRDKAVAELDALQKLKSASGSTARATDSEKRSLEMAETTLLQQVSTFFNDTENGAVSPTGKAILDVIKSAVVFAKGSTGLACRYVESLLLSYTPLDPDSILTPEAEYGHLVVSLRDFTKLFGTITARGSKTWYASAWSNVTSAMKKAVKVVSSSSTTALQYLGRLAGKAQNQGITSAIKSWNPWNMVKAEYGWWSMMALATWGNFTAPKADGTDRPWWQKAFGWFSLPFTTLLSVVGGVVCSPIDLVCWATGYTPLSAKVDSWLLPKTVNMGPAPI